MEWSRKTILFEGWMWHKSDGCINHQKKMLFERLHASSTVGKWTKRSLWPTFPLGFSDRRMYQPIVQYIVQMFNAQPVVKQSRFSATSRGASSTFSSRSRLEELFGLQTKMPWRARWFRCYGGGGDQVFWRWCVDDFLADVSWSSPDQIPWSSSRLGENPRKTSWGGCKSVKVKGFVDFLL